MDAYSGSKLLFIVSIVYFISLIFYSIYIIKPKLQKIGNIAFQILLFGAFLHVIVIIMRGLEANHAPFQTLYEALSWFALSVVTGFLILEWRSKVRLPGPIVIGIAIAACLYAIFGQSSVVKPLPPALQSLWFVFHVAVAFGSYAMFVVAFGIEIIFLLLKDGSRYNLEKPDIKLFHDMAYKLILFGFPLLTFCIVSGAFWAQAAWGTYWAWDPKETWSLITWTMYLLYLHARITPRWTSRRASVLNLLGFVCMIFTFVGVNWISKLLGIPSLHVY